MRRTNVTLATLGLLLLGGLPLSHAQGAAKPNRASVTVAGGEIEMPYVGEPTEKAITAQVTFGELQTKTQWAPSAFVGFRSLDGKTQLKAFLTQNGPNDMTLLAGYQVVVNGRAQQPKTLVNKIPLHEPITFRAVRNTNGDVQVQVAGSKMVSIGNGGLNLSPFVGVSSASATVV